MSLHPPIIHLDAIFETGAPLPLTGAGKKSRLYLILLKNTWLPVFSFNKESC